eukprot:6211795-Pleurochrysis_carterae.AAC.1
MAISINCNIGARAYGLGLRNGIAYFNKAHLRITDDKKNSISRTERSEDKEAAEPKLQILKRPERTFLMTQDASVRTKMLDGLGSYVNTLNRARKRLSRSYPFVPVRLACLPEWPRYLVLLRRAHASARLCTIDEMYISSIYRYTTNRLLRWNSPQRDPLAKGNIEEYYLAANA